MPEFVFRFFCAPAVYTVMLFAVAACSAAAAWFLLSVRKENVEKRAAFPRAKVPGIILCAVVLLWCIPNAMPVLPENLHRYLLPAALVLIVLSWIALDHLFARAIAGFMILTAHYFLYHSYAEPELLSPVFAAMCLIFGTIGIWYSGMPYGIRDLIRKSVEPRFRYWMPCFLLLFALVSCLTGICRLRGYF